MKVAKHMRDQIDKGGDDKLWTYKDFASLSQLSVAKAYSRFVQQGLLVRARKGIYYKPKQTVLGKTSPDDVQLTSLVLGRKKKAMVFAGGTGAFYNARLTTQVPVSTTIISDTPHRKMKLGNKDIKVIHRSLSHFKNASLQDISLIQSLRDIQKIPDSTASEAIVKILKMLGSDKARLGRMVQYAGFEPPRVRALVGAMAHHLKYMDDRLKKLKKSLNPLTKYKLNVGHVLPTAADWNII